eukprot:7693465-Alexandrium_andersonii.AAC.1
MPFRTSTSVKAAQLGLSRCAGGGAMTDPPRGQGRAASTEARGGSLRTASTPAPSCEGRCF